MNTKFFIASFVVGILVSVLIIVAFQNFNAKKSLSPAAATTTKVENPFVEAPSPTAAVVNPFVEKESNPFEAEPTAAADQPYQNPFSQ